MKLSPGSQKKISQLFEGLSAMTGMTAALTDLYGVLLASSDPKPACRDFHRAHDQTRRLCEESDKAYCHQERVGAEAYSVYTCPLGINNAVMDIRIKNEKVGCVFGGQFFLQKPDLDFFRNQAFLYGYPEEVYLRRIEEIPVITRDKLLSHLRMIHRLAVFTISVEETKEIQVQEEYELVQSNEELESAFQQLQASEEALRNQYEELLKKEKMVYETEERYSYAVEGSRDGVWDWHVPSGKNYISHRWAELLGYELSQVEGNVEFFKSLVHPEDENYVNSVLEKFLDGSCEQQEYEFRMRSFDGSYRWIRSRGKIFEWDKKGSPIRIVGTQTDVTENRMLEHKLKDSQRRIEMALEASGDGWWDTNYETGEAVISDTTREIWGVDTNVLPADKWQQLIHPEDRDRVLKEEKDKLKRKRSFSHQYRILRPDSSLRWVLDRGRAVDVDPNGKILRVSGMMTDITKKISEQKQYNRRKMELEALFDYSPDALVYTGFQDGEYRIQMINKRFEKLFGYSEEEVLGKDIDRLIMPEDEYEVGREISEIPYSKKLYEGRGIRRCKNGEMVAVRIRVGPTELNGQVVGAQCSYTDIRKLLSTENQLRKTLKDTVRSLSRISEKRDLYTSDHQKRVASLAVAIGKAMGWGENRIDGLRTAALLHDIGKIMIPSEILSKPSRLTKLEFEFIKTHPQNAYEILKNIEFEWPVADMVLQHHERCDGSGYPQGLKKEFILPEAQILIVADVVEAISSHRPYRPALGIAVALEEIENHCGSWYDEDVAKVCLALFKQGSFSFDQSS